MAAPAAPVMGKDGKLYYNSGTHGSPTWVLISNVGDIKVTDERDKEELDLRSQGGFTVTAMGQRKIGYEWQAIWDPADTVLLALKGFYEAGTAKEFLVLDGPQATAGSTGILATFVVTKFPRQEEISKSMKIDIAIAPAYSSNAPVAYTAS